VSFTDKIFGGLINRNSSRLRLYAENKLFAENIPADSLVLDAGAGDAPYKSLLAHTRYESADFEMVDKPYAKSTYVCDLQSIPVEDARFDYIFFNQTMEHLPQPHLALKELFRVLKPGGKLIYTAPLFYEEHEQPYDFYRYTQFGIRFLFEGAGFEFERLDWLEGYYSAVGYQVDTMARYLPAKPAQIMDGPLGYVLSPLFVVLKVQLAALKVFFHWLEMKKKVTTRGFPKNYVAILIRPHEATSTS
jgi:SAM-dependent methyltransferase